MPDEALEVETLVSDSPNGPTGVLAYYVRGHIPFEEFRALVMEQHEADAEPQYLSHQFMRKVPDRTGDFEWKASLSRNGGRGAMAVTYFDVNRQWCDRYEAARHPAPASDGLTKQEG